MSVTEITTVALDANTFSNGLTAQNDQPNKNSCCLSRCLICSRKLNSVLAVIVGKSSQMIATHQLDIEEATFLLLPKQTETAQPHV
jgi:hypothetical protein